jgi:hypothetical protein
MKKRKLKIEKTEVGVFMVREDSAISYRYLRSFATRAEAQAFIDGVEEGQSL